MRGREADAADAVDLGHGVDEQAEIGDAAVVHRSAIGIDVLAEQVDLAHALFGELGDLGQHVVERSADFLATRVRNHAEAAVLRAAFHDRDERRGTLGTRFGQAVELLDFGKADVDLRLAALPARLDHPGQPVQGLRSEHEVDERRAPDDRIALLAGHAAADADDHRGLVLLELLPAAELAEHLLLGLLADRAGIDQDDVRLGGILGQHQAVRRAEDVGHLRRVVLVHLATVGLDVQLSGHGNWRIVSKPSSLRTGLEARQQKMAQPDRAPAPGPPSQPGQQVPWFNDEYAASA